MARMDPKKTKLLSKTLSYVLRHAPEKLDLRMDEGGWVEVSQLLENLEKINNLSVTIEDLTYIVKNNDKKRFSFNDQETKIRANQGHSIKIDLGLRELVPPKILYHGTALRFLDSIKKGGLQRGERHHVHLSENIDTARAVGSRHGKPVILEIDCQGMQDFAFYRSENGVWLVYHVPPQFIKFPTHEE